jgi:(p)ppGpp synthase/HD superfamily hydrolase
MKDLVRLLAEVLNDTDMKEITRAYEFAEEKHKGQTRIGGGDYIQHPVRVAIAASVWAKSNEASLIKLLAVVSLLHDTIEDTDASFAEVSELFGEEVAKAVMALSHEDEDEPDEVYLTRVKEGGKIAVLTKRFDKLDNIKSLDDTSAEFRESKIEENMRALPIWKVMDPEGAELIKTALKEVQDGNSSPESGS